jgi:hypothetical protein
LVLDQAWKIGALHFPSHRIPVCWIGRMLFFHNHAAD